MFVEFIFEMKWANWKAKFNNRFVWFCFEEAYLRKWTNESKVGLYLIWGCLTLPFSYRSFRALVKSNGMPYKFLKFLDFLL